MIFKERCTQCKCFDQERWPSRYKRIVGTLNPKPFLCKDCKRIKFVLENPDVIEQRQKQREQRLIEKSKLKEQNKIFKKNRLLNDLNRFQVYSTSQEAQATFLELKKKKTNSSKRYLNSEKGKAIYRESMAKRRAKMLNCLIDMTSEERIKIREFYAKRPDGYHIDHIIPISKGGKHCFENLRYLKASENLKKKNNIDSKILELFLNENEKISITWLQRKFKMEFKDAKKLIQDLKLEKK